MSVEAVFYLQIKYNVYMYMYYIHVVYLFSVSDCIALYWLYSGICMYKKKQGITKKFFCLSNFVIYNTGNPPPPFGFKESLKLYGREGASCTGLLTSSTLQGEKNM